MKAKTAGRKKLPPEQKKMPVVIYLTQCEIESMGGMETVKRYLSFAAKERIERKMKNEF